MERNSSGALRAPGAFGASGTSDPHATLSSCSLHITHVCWLPAVLRPSTAAPLTTRPAAAPAPPAPGPLPLFSACKSVAVLRQAVRVCLLSEVLTPSVDGRSTSCGAASGRTGASGASLRVLRTHCGVAESGFIGRRRRLGRALYPPTDARFE